MDRLCPYLRATEVCYSLNCGLRHGKKLGMAYPFLAPATESPDHVAEKVRRIVQELKICLFCLGVKTVAELRSVPLRKGT